MALELNLLHETIQEQKQRQRDPLKIGTLVLCVIGVALAAYYMWNGYQVLEIKGRLTAVERDWAKVEPKVTAAQKRSAELNDIISSTNVLEKMIEGRFYWATFLQHVSKCIAPNTQLTNVNGLALEDNKGVTATLEGVAAGREARAAAEDLRQMLSEQLGKSYTDVVVEFKSLEDLDTIVNVAGANVPMARFVLGVTLNPLAPGAAKPAPPAPKRTPKQ
jgi:hypothetical protein